MHIIFNVCSSPCTSSTLFRALCKLQKKKGSKFLFWPGCVLTLLLIAQTNFFSFWALCTLHMHEIWLLFCQNSNKQTFTLSPLPQLWSWPAHFMLIFRLVCTYFFLSCMHMLCIFLIFPDLQLSLKSDFGLYVHLGTRYWPFLVIFACTYIYFYSLVHKHCSNQIKWWRKPVFFDFPMHTCTFRCSSHYIYELLRRLGEA